MRAGASRWISRQTAASQAHVRHIHAKLDTTSRMLPLAEGVRGNAGLPLLDGSVA